MEEPVQEEKIRELLAKLNSENEAERTEAADQIRLEHIKDDRLLERLKFMTTEDTSPYVRAAAYDAMQSVHTAGSEVESSAQAAPPIPTSAKRRHFVIGFLGWFLINGIAWFVFSGGTLDATAASTAGCVTLPVNLVVLLAFALARRLRWVALGILVAIALNFLVALIRGMTINGVCFIPFFFNTGLNFGRL